MTRSPLSALRSPLLLADGGRRMANGDDINFHNQRD